LAASGSPSIDHPRQIARDFRHFDPFRSDDEDRTRLQANRSAAKLHHAFSAPPEDARRPGATVENSLAFKL